MLKNIIDKTSNLTNEERDYLNRLNAKLTPTDVDSTGDDDMDYFVCPNCKHELVSMDSIDYCELDNFCSHCGQALKWDNKYTRC